VQKTLYISDLDGTLLNGSQALSARTVEIINSLTKRGMLFSYATARSYVTAAKVTGGFASSIPAIVYNGAFIIENGTGKRLLEKHFTEEESRYILNTVMEHGVYPIVYAFVEGRERFSYVVSLQSEGCKRFNKTRKGDLRDAPVSDTSELYRGEIFHFTCIDTPEKLYPLYCLLRERFECIYHVDIYSGDQWLEVQPPDVSKAEGVRALKRMLGCERVVCFGDGVNDIPMFEICDECYAVENAHHDLKKIATAVIPSNDRDGVALWLLENYK